ncbi:MAG: phosphoribosylamine--glycine ligase family protein, partial [Dehalococcoidia bacterium]|nr:phosphoribosylamine--glycine ligase family protein [Dehalococcoidia bacterium]
MVSVTTVLIVGNGAREHAIAWKIASSPHKPRILTAPGNAGTAQLGSNFDVSAGDIDGLIALAHKESVDLTIVGPE